MLSGSPGYRANVAIAFAPDGKRILTGSTSNTARLWDMEGNELLSFQTAEPVSSVAFSPDGKMILTGSIHKIARLWDLEGNELKNFQHTKSVVVVAFSPDGKLLLTGGGDSIIRLWDFEGNEIKNFRASANFINAVTFSPDGKTILVGSSYELAKLWDLEGNELQSFQGYMVPKENSTFWNNQVFSKIAVAFSHNGKIILTGAEDGKVKLWDLEGNELKNFQGASAAITSLAFSPDDKTILVGSKDKTARLWLNPIACLVDGVANYSNYELESSGLAFTEEDWKNKKEW